MPLVFTEDDLRAQRWVKEAFDPRGLCNPGKVLPPAAEPGALGAHPTADPAVAALSEGDEDDV
jgi:glycolate oxidase